ncbi:hypothetical protein Poli38472_014333 [Pythium oligandrum]|uniref:Cyclic nucleotide-binding domain-containing protein n=1 Tax=Pythium oligandrum TaxID=41045 RepID=A0A8K1C782_PYTOL|nr:hypothetical protein Poli38472_014333 [Pythium oligandrum]|eukprot:TMW57730.1 hypothetical protein Poli38472_014333 [Pythium oligandrum]
MVLPFLAVFKSGRSEWFSSQLIAFYVCELLFIADVYVELNTGYYEDGNVTLDVTKSRAKYIRSKRFLLDVLALPPWSALLLPLDLSVSPVFLEFHKFLRVWRVPKYVSVLDDIYAKHFVVLKMFKVLLVIILLSHFVACARFLFGYDEHHVNHWLPQHPPMGQSSQTKYLMSLFWAFGLLNGLFEGELPHTTIEFLFTIFVALCGFSLFTYLCATFFMISKCESGYIETSDARINQLKHLLSFHHVPESLQLQAIEYLKRYHTLSESNDREAMRLLCPSIAKDIQVALLKEMVGNILFFKECNEQFIIAITSLLELVSLPANIIVFNAGEEGDAMYFVNTGVLHVLVDGVKIREVRKGAFFGEMALFLKRPRYATVVTTTYCTLYKLVRFHMDRLFEGYPEYARMIPKRVSEMARVLFGRLSGEALLIPDETLHHGDDQAKVEPKLKFSALIRKHIKRGDKSKVTPSDAPQESAPSLSLVAATGTKVHPSPADPKCGGNSEAQEARISSAVTTDREAVTDQRRSTAGMVSQVLSEFYSQIGWKPTGPQKRYWWSPLLLSTAIEAESRRRLWWLVVLQLILIYNWTIIPLQLSFQALRRDHWLVLVLNVGTDLVLWCDIYLNMNLSYTEESEKIWDTTRCALRYFRSWFVVDFMCILPYWFIAQAYHHAIPRLPRLLRVVRLSRHLEEADAMLKLTSKQRLLLFGLLLIMLYHIVACLYFSITYLEGFSANHDSWIPSNDVLLRMINATHFVDVNNVTYWYTDPYIAKIGTTQYFRALYYAANVLTALGRTIEPASDTQYAAALVFMLSGFFITAIVVDNVQKRFTASALEQKEFYATRSHIQLFLRRQKAPLAIHKRVNAFLDYWWSSHRGAVIHELLEELPETIKRDVLNNICQPALQTLALLNGVRPVLTDLENVFLDNLKFILYGQGEIVYRQGDFASGIFFLLEGQVCVSVDGSAPRSVPQGGFFGTAALQLDGNTVSYSERVTATSGCIVLFVSRGHLLAMKNAFSSLEESLLALERRFLDPKLAKASEFHTITRRLSSSQFLSRLKLFQGEDRIFDPDSMHILTWETWLFVAMTIQWVSVMFRICFGVSPENIHMVDSILVLLEVSFVIDVFIRSRLGYYQFGNKVMIPKLVKSKYFRSVEFAVDVVALLPLFTINWAFEPSQRLEILNMNKLLRLVKVPMQFTALENKYLTRTVELRLFKLVYYTFLLSHTFGCIWFDFASNVSGIHSLVDEESASARDFGSYLWLPPSSYEDASLSMQYFGSLFWSFALMSASQQGELPKTVSQCFFSVVTMTCGFFLFAYVIGNFSDTIELMDAENREYYAHLNSLRHMLSHFRLPGPIADKFKTYFFFKRFHSITQEHLLERCLPPSLLTDIRMVHLQPMIVKVTFLSGMDANVTRMLVSQFSQLLVVRDEFVYKYGEEGSDMYFVFTGLLETLLPHDELIRNNSLLERKSSSLHLPKEHEGGPSTNASSNPAVRHRLTMRQRGGQGAQNKLTKFNEVAAGSYFGENALFFNSVRTSYVQAKTSCILYKLSRHSLELVFDRYPDWKEKVLQIMTIQQEQQRLNRMAAEVEQSTAMGDVMAKQNEAVHEMAERFDDAVKYFRRMKTSSGRRKMSQTTKQMLSGGLEKAQESKKAVRTCAPRWMHEFIYGTHAQSRYHLIWLRLISLASLYVSILVPYRISFDQLDRDHWLPVLCRELELVCEILFIWDIWVNWRLKGSSESMELYEQEHREAYKRERLRWDLLAAFPLDYLTSSVGQSPWYRINRCFKIRNFLYYMSEINRRSIYNEMHRLRSTFLIYFVAIYWTASAFFVIAIYDRYGDEWNAWLPSEDLRIPDGEDPSSKLVMLRLLRGFFFATTAFVKKGRTFTPDSTMHFAFAIMVCFFGLLMMAFMIGEIASLFISYIGNEVEYRKNHIAVELYLGRWKIQGDLKARTQAFLTSLWSSYRGVDYQMLLDEVPASIRKESILNIASWPLKAFCDDIFRPLCLGDHSISIDTLTQSLAQHLRFEGYPRGEMIVVEGSISKAMFLVTRGLLRATSKSNAATYTNLSYVKGDYFGERGLLGYSVSAFSVQTMRACDLLSLSSEALLGVLHSHPTYSVALKVADHAALEMKARPLSSDMEQRWGQMLLDVLDEKRKECDNCDQETRYTAKKMRAVLDRSFTYKSHGECYGAFRPFLQIIVPNGMLHLHGVSEVRRPSVPSTGVLAAVAALLRMRSITPTADSQASTEPTETTGPSPAREVPNKGPSVGAHRLKNLTTLASKQSTEEAEEKGNEADGQDATTDWEFSRVSQSSGPAESEVPDLVRRVNTSPLHRLSPRAMPSSRSIRSPSPGNLQRRSIL